MNQGIEFINVTKRYGGDGKTPLSAYAVKGISFTVEKGTLTTILGPSGCGKTTTLRMIAGLESPSSGQIIIAGKDVTTLGPAQRNVSLVFQSYALFPHMNVIENVAYGLTVSNMPKAEAHERARATLQSVGLVGFDTRLPSELSGGQQQRVAVARALVLEPAVLLFDEPLSNLDARLRRSMREEIRSLQQKLNLTVAYVTHDQSEALAVSDQIIVMDHGVIAQSGTPQQLYEQPASEFVAGFMGEAMLFDGTALDSGEVQLGPLCFTPRQAVGLGTGLGLEPGKVKVAVRPDAWSFQTVSSADGSQLSATVSKRAYLGNVFEYTLDTELGALFVVSTDMQNARAPGEAVRLSLASHGVSVVKL